MELNEKYYGFKVVRVRKSEELQGTLWELKHEKTGAEVVWLESDEENKLFSISFKTIPTDNTGVFHILEHSVLNGSEKYPVKEPFVELLKSSMNTFLNAMTFTDKTIYPISSRNEQDYLNLTSVYLDAVFKPLLLNNPNIFYQEGWRLEVADGEELPSYNGVVFNEMKGSYSDITRNIITGLNSTLYNESCYQYDSGGTPESIPGLSYDKFINTFKKYYHPSNARVYLDGRLPIEKVLKMMDEEYFSNYEELTDLPEIHLQKEMVCKETIINYESMSDMDECHMAMGKIVCSWDDREKIVALFVILDYLMGNNEAVLKRKLLNSGLIQDADVFLEDDIAQPCVTFVMKQMDYENRDKIKGAIKEALAEVISEGIDKTEIEAVLSQTEFRLKEIAEPKGLTRCISALNTWNFGGDPMDGLCYDNVMANLRSKVDTDYFISLIKELPGFDDNYSVVYAMPSKTKGEDDRAEEEAELRQIYESWNEKDIERIRTENADLVKWQEEENSPEALAKLPKLPVSEIGKAPIITRTEVLEEDSVPVLFHKANTGGITHCKLYFSMADLPVETMGNMSFLTNLFEELPTRNYSLNELITKEKSILGSIDFSVIVHPVDGKVDTCCPYFLVEFSALDSKVEEGISLVAEIVNETILNGELAKTIIGQILLQGEENVKQRIITVGNRVAIMRSMSHTSASAYVNEKLEGYSFYSWLKEFDENFDERIDNYIEFINKVQQEIFDERHLTISLTCHEPGDLSKKIIKHFSKGNKDDIVKTMNIELGELPSEGIAVPSSVSFATISANIKSLGYEFDGGIDVLSQLLGYNYLWNEIRVRGGAYGCGLASNVNGDLAFYSYSDPNPANSLNVYAKTAEYLRDFVNSDEEFKHLLVATASSQEPLVSVSAGARTADNDYFRGITFQDRTRLRKDVINMKKENLLNYVDLLDKVAENSSCCIVGSKELIESCKVENILEL